MNRDSSKRLSNTQRTNTLQRGYTVDAADRMYVSGLKEIARMVDVMGVKDARKCMVLLNGDYTKMRKEAGAAKRRQARPMGVS